MGLGYDPSCRIGVACSAPFRVSESRDMQTPGTGWDFADLLRRMRERCIIVAGRWRCQSCSREWPHCDTGGLHHRQGQASASSCPGDLKMLSRQDARYAGTAAWLGSGWPIRQTHRRGLSIQHGADQVTEFNKWRGFGHIALVQKDRPSRNRFESHALLIRTCSLRGGRARGILERNSVFRALFRQDVIVAMLYP